MDKTKILLNHYNSTIYPPERNLNTSECEHIHAQLRNA
jgi:hypothetical protein